MIIVEMSLLIPNARDYVDAHEDLDQDTIFLSKRASRNSKVAEYWQFEPVHGFFKQSNEETDDMKFNYGLEDFGIETGDWKSLVDKLDQLNKDAAEGDQYKLFFLARHGQGWHNIASHKYSGEGWQKKWRFLGTDGDIEWGPDARLTEIGEKQATENNQYWREQIQKGAPIPSKFYVSPLQRSSHTLVETWKGIGDDKEPLPDPIVIERLRETIGVHLCHKRASKSTIASRFPGFVFEEGFTEEDELFEEHTPNREKLHEQFMRINLVLESLFESNEDHSIISITSHAGTIRAFITAIGHRKFTIPTGGMIPIVVKGRKHTNAAHKAA